ncbi:MAG: sodium:calcium antiporter [Desulfotignum sp.]
MVMAVFALVAGLILLVWSADRFVEGAAATAGYFGMPPLLIGMVVVGFETSAPEMVVSALAAVQGSPGIALGNAGIIHPFEVEPATLSRDMVVMGALTLSLFVIGYGVKGRQGRINRFEGAVLLAVYIGYTIYLLRTVIILQP